MINWLSAILAIFGFYLATLRLFCKHVDPGFKNSGLSRDREEAYFFLFLSFLAWAVSSGLMALVPVWGYFTDASLLSRYCLNGAIGFILLVIGCPVLHNYRKVGVLFSSIRFERKEKFILSFIALVLLMYAYRVTIPWADWDETRCYGYLSKLIAGGRTFRDLFQENALIEFVRSQLVQSWDAQLYSLVNDTYLVRLNRLFNLLFCGLGVFTFLRLIRVRRFWSLAAVAGFLSIPELSYLALSLKVDSVVMMFELTAFLSIIMAFVIYWHEEKSEGLPRIIFYLSTIALLLTAFAFGTRFSGLISMGLCACCACFFLIRQTKRPFASLGGVLALSAFFMFIVAPGYWMNLLIYNNPVYPLKPFWPFQSGAYVYDFGKLSIYNILGLPPVFLQIYLIFALGSGLELLAKALPFLNCLPMAAAKTQSMGWPYPLILCIFFWPFFMKSRKVLNLVAGIFIFQLILWSLTLHYSRVFIASSILTILAAVIMADQGKLAQDSFRFRVQKVLKFWIIFSLILSLLFQFWWFGKRYWGPFLAGAEKRYYAKIGFLKTKDYQEKNEPSLRDIEMLNSFLLNAGDKPVVYVLTYSREVMQILFDKHIYIKAFNLDAPWAGGGKYLLINPKFLEDSKVWNMQALADYFPVHVLTTPENKWELYTVAGFPHKR